MGLVLTISPFGYETLLLSFEHLGLGYQPFLGVAGSFSLAGVAQLWLDARMGRFKRWTHKVV